MSSDPQPVKPAARVAVKVPQPDSLVEVRVTPPDSHFEVKVSPGSELIELLIHPGSSLIEVRISPPSLTPDEQPADGGQEDRPESQEVDEYEEEVVTGVSRSEFAAMVAEEEAAEAKKLLAQMDNDQQGLPDRAYELPEEIKQILADDADDLDEAVEGDALPDEPPPEVDEEEVPPTDLTAAAEVGGDEDTPDPTVEAENLDLSRDSMEATDPPPAEDVEEILEPAPGPIGEAADEEETEEETQAEPTAFMPETTEVEVMTEALPIMADPEPPAPDFSEEALETTPEEFEDQSLAMDMVSRTEVAAEEPATEDEAPEIIDQEPAPAMTEEETGLLAEDEYLAADEDDGPEAAETLEAEIVEEPAEALNEKDEADSPFELSQAEAEVTAGEAVELQGAEAPELPPEMYGEVLDEEELETTAAVTEPQAPLSLETPEGETFEEPEPDREDSQPAGGIGVAARQALARLSAAVSEEREALQNSAAPEEENRPQEDNPPPPDSTIMVEIIDDGEPAPQPEAATALPLPEEERMDLSLMEEEDEELIIGPVDLSALEVDLDKSRLPGREAQSVIKARPMLKVNPANTIVPD